MKENATRGHGKAWKIQVAGMHGEEGGRRRRWQAGKAKNGECGRRVGAVKWE